MFNKETFVFENKIYPVVEVSNFETADGYNIDYGVFTSEGFIDAYDDSLMWRIIDDRIYGYLPRELLDNGTESQIRDYIKTNIG